MAIEITVLTDRLTNATIIQQRLGFVKRNAHFTLSAQAWMGVGKGPGPQRYDVSSSGFHQAR